MSLDNEASISQPGAPWYEDGLRFECTECGRCCCGEPGFVWITGDDVERISAKLGLASGIFEQVFSYIVRGRKRSLKEYPNGDCVLLDEKNRGCKVYEVRPVQCRTWPFWTQNIDSPKSWEITAKFCPGCNHGQLYSFEEIEQRRLAIEL